MSERAQLERLYDAANEARSAMLLAYSELILGGDWQSARDRINDAGDRLDKAMETVARTLSKEQTRLAWNACIDLYK